MAKTFHFKSKYLNDHGVVIKTSYTDGSTAIQLEGVFGEPLITVTVNLSEYKMYPAEGNIFIRSYGPHEGMYEMLKSLGMVGDVVRTIGIGHGTGVECPWLLADEDMRVLENG